MFILRTYANWRLFPRLRRKIDRNLLTDSGIKWCQTRLRVAAAFLSWLRESDILLQSCSQHHIDAWLSSSPSTAYGIRDFVRWTWSRRFSRKLTVPRRSIKLPAAAIDEKQRWAEVERLLHDNALPLDLRLSALLGLVFGQHLSRICLLTVENVTRKGSKIYVKFGKDDVVMPPDIARLVNQQAQISEQNPKGLMPNEQRWLFPGQGFGTHLTPDALGRRLTALGIYMRPARNAALMHLAARLEPVILAQMLNLHENVAAEWCRAAGRTFNKYVELRASASTLPHEGSRKLRDMAVPSTPTSRRYK